MPSSLLDKLITWARTSPATVLVLPGTHKTHQLLQGKYWWPWMLQVIQWFIASCSVCDKAKVPHTFPTGKLIPVQIPQRPWSYIAIDFLTNLPPSQNKTVIMMIVERFSKTLCLDFPLPILPSDFEMAEIVLEHVFNTLSSPEDIVSDRGFS